MWIIYWQRLADRQHAQLREAAELLGQLGQAAAVEYQVCELA